MPHNEDEVKNLMEYVNDIHDKCVTMSILKFTKINWNDFDSET